MRVHCALLVLAITASSQTFRDPAPPKVNPVSPQADSLPAANTDVRFHKKPKPLAKGAVTSDWPYFLGPTHDAVSPETKLLHKFPGGGPAKVWEMKKGTGYSSPSISGGRLVFLHRVGNREIVECLKADTGERFWQHAYPTDYEDRYGYNNGPRASPVIDGDRVYTIGAQGKLFCLRLATGQVMWARDLLAEFKVPQDFFGVAGTPLLEGDALIFNVGAPGGPTVIAIDKNTGKLLWGTGKEWGASYASPMPGVVQGQRRVFVLAGGESNPPTGGLLVIDPKIGAVDFTFPWRSKSYESVNASCPIVLGNNVFISASYKTGGAMLEIQPGMKHKVAWTTPEFGLHFNTPIHKDGFLYGYDGRNEPDASLAAVDAKTGKVAWRETPGWEETISVQGQERRQFLGMYRGTLLQTDGQFLSLGELGHLVWMDLSPKGYKEVSRTRLFLARQSWSLPVLSRGLLYVVQHDRDVTTDTGPRLICYDLRGE